MAVWSARWDGTIPFSDTTEQVVYAAAAFLSGVEIHIQKDATAADVFVQLFDASGVTPGSTGEDLGLFIPSGDITRGQFMFRYIIPNTQFATGIEIFPSTASGGGTASAILADIRVFFNPIA